MLLVCHSLPTRPVLYALFHLSDSSLKSCSTGSTSPSTSDHVKIIILHSSNEILEDVNPNQVFLRIIEVIGSKSDDSNNDSNDINNNEPILIQLKYLDNSNSTTL